MTKLLWLSVVVLLGLMLVAGCGRRSSNVPEMTDGAISRYLPITLYDQFRLTVLWAYPHEKTYFTESELEIINQTINSFRPYGPKPPWGDERLAGAMPILYVTNENHEVTIHFIGHSQWGTFVLVLIDDEPEQWFTVESDLVSEITGLLRRMRRGDDTTQ